MNTRCLPPVSAWGLLACGLLCTGVVQAAAVAGPNGTAAQGVRLIVATPTATADSAPALIPGRITAVDLAAGRVHIDGAPLAWTAEQLRVIGPDGQRLAGAAALRAGQQVRFALEPLAPGAITDPQRSTRRLLLVYIDRQP